MIGMLTGTPAAIDADRCILDVGGVGYLVFASTRTLAAIAETGPTRLLIETQVREDAITLFGFSDAAERDWFRLLTGVQGVGARLALNILSILGPTELAAAITAGDRAGLTRAAGVGAKLAIRLVTELRDKSIAPPIASGPISLSPAGAAADALSALINLGYRRAEAQSALARAEARLGAQPPLEVLIREGLKELT